MCILNVIKWIVLIVLSAKKYIFSARVLSVFSQKPNKNKKIKRFRPILDSCIFRLLTWKIDETHWIFRCIMETMVFGGKSGFLFICSIHIPHEISMYTPSFFLYKFIWKLLKKKTERKKIYKNVQ